MGGTNAAITINLNTVDIDTCHQSATTINGQIPVNRYTAIRWDAILHVFP